MRHKAELGMAAGLVVIVSALSSTACLEEGESEPRTPSLKAALSHTPPKENQWFSLSMQVSSFQLFPLTHFLFSGL